MSKSRLMYFSLEAKWVRVATLFPARRAGKAMTRCTHLSVIASRTTKWFDNKKRIAVSEKRKDRRIKICIFSFFLKQRWKIHFNYAFLPLFNRDLLMEPVLLNQAFCLRQSNFPYYINLEKTRLQ